MGRPSSTLGVTRLLSVVIRAHESSATETSRMWLCGRSKSCCGRESDGEEELLRYLFDHDNEGDFLSNMSQRLFAEREIKTPSLAASSAPVKFGPKADATLISSTVAKDTVNFSAP